jgi:hypothetical protein
VETCSSSYISVEILLHVLVLPARKRGSSSLLHFVLHLRRRHCTVLYCETAGQYRYYLHPSVFTTFRYDIINSTIVGLPCHHCQLVLSCHPSASCAHSYSFIRSLVLPQTTSLRSFVVVSRPGGCELLQ